MCVPFLEDSNPTRGIIGHGEVAFEGVVIEVVHPCGKRKHRGMSNRVYLPLLRWFVYELSCAPSMRRVHKEGKRWGGVRMAQEEVE